MKYILITIGLLWSTVALSDEVSVKMLNRLDKESMVFSEKIVKINVGDSVF